MPKKVSATIVTYRGYEKAYKAVESLLRFTKGVELTLYIVDNASKDGTAKKLKEAFPSIQLIEMEKNKGFGDGHNAVLPFLDSDYHAVVNPDILLDRDVLTELSDYLNSNPDVGLVTPKILNLDGSDQELPKRNPTVLSLLGRRILRSRLQAEVEYYQMKDKDLSVPTDIEFATGCFFLIRTPLFQELKGFDTRFFMYYEDMDITRRVRKTARAVYFPSSYVYHAWERSSAHSLKFFWILIVGMFKYFGKWGYQFRYPKKEIETYQQSKT